MLPAILALEGTNITSEEHRLFKESQPLGFILFKRNVESPDQLKALITELKSLMGRDCPILIDQEGGRVQRLRPPHWTNYPAAGDYKDEKDYQRLEDDMNALAGELKAMGINVNCAPVLDLRYDVETDIVGDRAYGMDIDHVIQCGQIVCDVLRANDIMPVIKHLPGHGRALFDTHHQEAHIDAPLEALRQSDFIPFQKSDAHWGMAAHVTLSTVDQLPTTLSKATISKVIRGEIGFDGVLLTDDLSMNALSAHGKLSEITLKSLQAGCDLALYCAGKLKEMEELANALPEMSADLNARLGPFAV